MSDERDRGEAGRSDELPSVEQLAGLDRFLDELVADKRPAPHDLTAEEARAAMLAAQLRLAREGVEEPSPAFLQRLERDVTRAARDAGGRGKWRMTGVSRGGFLRAAATLVGGAGLGVAGVEAVAAVEESQRPHDLVVAGNERWYLIATVGEVPPGGMKAFSAGGVLGYLVNDDGRLHAVSAICTHMGCRLKPADPAPGAGLRCLCHGSRFNRRGEVMEGLAPVPLPAIKVQVASGKVYALGTRETV